jgi:hypothetical protein
LQRESLVTSEKKIGQLSTSTNRYILKMIF